MKVLIDTETLNEYNLSINEFLAIFKIHSLGEGEVINFDAINPNIYEDLQRKRFIKIIDDKYILRSISKSLLDALLFEGNVPVSIARTKTVKNKSDRLINRILDENLETYRNKWKGLKPGSMGAPQAIKDKLSRWMKSNPDYSFEQVLTAVDMYIETQEAPYSYLQRADYFIYKKEGKDEVSRLSAFIDEVDFTSKDGWTSELN